MGASEWLFPQLLPGVSDQSLAYRQLKPSGGEQYSTSRTTSRQSRMTPGSGFSRTSGGSNYQLAREQPTTPSHWQLPSGYPHSYAPALLPSISLARNPCPGTAIRPNLGVIPVRPVERREGETRGGLDNGLGFAVEEEVAAHTVPRTELLACHRDGAVGAVPHEHRIRTCRDEDPGTPHGGGGGGTERRSLDRGGVRAGWAGGRHGHLGGSRVGGDRLKPERRGRDPQERQKEAPEERKRGIFSSPPCRVFFARCVSEWEGAGPRRR